MKLLTKQIENALPALYATEKIEAGEKVAVVKFFHPASSWTAYGIEYDPQDRLFFGYVVCLDKELGYFSLDEIESTVVRGLKVERDRSFRPTKLKDLADFNK